MFDMCVKLFYSMDILSDVKVAGNIDANGYMLVRGEENGIRGIYSNRFNLVSNFDNYSGNGIIDPVTEIYITSNKIYAPKATTNFKEINTNNIYTTAISMGGFMITSFAQVGSHLRIPTTTEIYVTIPAGCNKLSLNICGIGGGTTDHPIVNAWNCNTGKLIQMDFCFDGNNKTLYAEMSTGFSTETPVGFVINRY